MSLLRRLADADDPTSLSNRLRALRFARFERLAATLPRPLRIIDLGGTPTFWAHRGWAGRTDVLITTVNLAPSPSAHVNIDACCGDVLDLSTYADDSFDVVFSNSVIEHLFSYEGQATMAHHVQRLAPAYWLQTPNFWFPIEPHFHVLGWQWLPMSWRTTLVRRGRCGWRGPCRSVREAEAAVREVRLLTHRELRQLFPDATIEAERFAGLAKSWIVHDGFPPVRAPRTDPERAPRPRAASRVSHARS